MKKLFLALICFFLLFLATNSFANKPKGGPPPARVEVKQIQHRKIQQSLKLVGTVTSQRVSRVGSEVTGLVDTIKVTEGESVKKGDPLVILKNSQLLIAIKEAKAILEEERQRLRMLKNGNRPSEINKAKAEAEEAEILWKKQKQELKRVKNLFEKKLLSENEYMNASLQSDALEKIFVQQKEQFELLKEGTRDEEIARQAARVESKKAQRAFLLDNKKKTTIVSPFDGVVVKKLVEEGEWITQGTEVVKVIQIDPVRIDIQAPEDIIHMVTKETEVTIEVDALPGARYKGKISHIIPEALDSSRTFSVRIILKNPDYTLKSGMTARVVLPYGEPQEAVLVPQDALIISGNQTFVYRLTEGNTAERVPLKTGRSLDGWVAVTGGLNEDDQVVVKGNERLRPGQSIVVNARP